MIQITLTIEENNGATSSRADFTPVDQATSLELDVLRSWRLQEATGPVKAAVLEMLKGSGLADKK